MTLIMSRLPRVMAVGLTMCLCPIGMLANDSALSFKKEKYNSSQLMQAVLTSGTVVDETGAPLTGASVRIKGKNQGTLTDIDGHFSISAEEGETLIISFVGYKDYVINVGQTNRTYSIKMLRDDSLLDEVVVIGYGTTTVRNSTGSITSIKSDDVGKVPSTNFANSLSGKVTGVQVIQPSGQPGKDAEIRIRGIGTLTAGSDPLIVVNGLPLSEGSTLNSINAASIESIEILKDAASTAIYGSRGANGIIMVKTKDGSESKPVVSFAASYGLQQRSDRVKLVNAYDFAIYQKEARNTGYVNKDPKRRSETDTNEERLKKGASKRQILQDYIMPYLNGEKGLTDTDWYSQIFRTAPMQNYNVTVSGGSDYFKYSFTSGYLNQTGILLGSDFEKYSANVNLWFKPSKRVVIGASLFPSFSKQHYTHTSNTWGGTLVGMAAIMYPFFSPYNADGSLAISEQIKANIGPDGALGENVVAWAKMLDNEKQNSRFFGNVYTELSILKDLKYKINLGTDFENIKTAEFKPSDIGQYRSAAPSPAFAENNKSSRKNFLIENTLDYNSYFGNGSEHNFGVLLGQSFQRENYEYVGINGTGFTDNSIRNIAGASGFKITPNQYEWTMISYFGRLNYSYLGRYLFNVSTRWDGSSRFGKNRKWGFFPAVSAAWIISNEQFAKTINGLNYAKLRFSWGQSGNNQIPNFGSLAMLKRSDYIFDGQLVSGSLISTSPNPDLSWEKTSTINVGFNLVLFKYLGIDFDYYIANTNDLLLQVPVPEQSGYKTSLQNLGQVRNTGVEVKLSTAQDLKLGQVFWNSSLTLSANRDKVIALAPGQSQIINGSNITRIGNAIGELYGYETNGLYKTQEDLDKYPHMAGTQLGDNIIVDLNGDGKITTEDKRSFGSPAPKFILGFGNSFRYKNFVLSFDLYSELGKQKFNGTLQSLNCGEGFMMITQDYFNNRWHPIDNPNGTWATPNLGNYSNTRKQAANSDLYFDDASYLQLRSLRLAYNLPKSLMDHIGIRAAQVYFLGNNLFMITPYKGFNVEAENSSNVLTQGSEKYAYPMPRTYSLGINITF